MSRLNAIIESYGQLEIEMRRCMQHVCAPFCGRCRATCCRPVYCREALDSPFLVEVRRRYSPEARWDAALGWLTSTGCRLEAGRPPVCYEFLCRTILDAQPSPQARSRLDALAVLLTKAGRRARGRRHVVELTDLDRIDAERLATQLAQARSVLDGLREELRVNQS